MYIANNQCIIISVLQLLQLLQFFFEGYGESFQRSKSVMVIWSKSIFPVFRDFQLGFYKCLNSSRISFKNLRFWVSRAIFATCLYVVRSTSRAAPASKWWTRAAADTVSCAALGQRARNGRFSVLRPGGGNMSRNTATPSFPFSAKALTRGLRSWSPV